jgi:hypothetical protein
MAARPPARHLALGLALLLAGCTGSTPTVAPSSAALGQVATSAPSPDAATPAPPTPAATPVLDPTPAPTVEPTADPTAEPTLEPTARPTAKPAQASGKTGRVVVEGEDLALKLPKGWVTLALSEGDVQRVIDALPDGAVPAGVKDQLPALIAAGLKMWAFDTRRADLGDNVNVVGQPVSIPYAFLRTAAQAAIAQYPTITHATYRDTKVDGEPALRVGYTMRLDLAGGVSIKETGTQLYIPRAGRLLVITITTRAGHSADDVKKLVNGIELLD